MSYEIEVIGLATIKVEGPSGLNRETDVDHETVTVDGEPTILTDGPAAVTIREVDDAE